MSVQPAIVVVAYNRARSLSRLLQSLDRANYDDQDARLVICIDYADSDDNREVNKVASEFVWRHGEKNVIAQDENLGLRKHVLACGDLSQKYGSIIMLEDDLTVGPEFYRYSKAALDFVSEDSAIGGVSLYDHRTNFVCRLPFAPLYDGHNNYYLQIASSWGQAWTSQQWSAFRNWYAELDENEQQKIPDQAPIPTVVINWPATSWLKYFIWYLAANQKFFLYPRFSHSTNHADAGANIDKGTVAWQVPLTMCQKTFTFSKLDESMAVYDSFFEVLPSRLKKLADNLSDFDFELDLYGTKRLSAIRSTHLLSSRPCSSAKHRFNLTVKPLEANLVETADSDGQGHVFSLAAVEDFDGSAVSNLNYRSLRVIQYFYAGFSLRDVLRNLGSYFLQKRKR